MAIIKFTQGYDLDPLRFNRYPDHFVSEDEKTKDRYKKDTMDYYANVAYAQYTKNKDLVRNYNLLKGILRPEDFYEEPEVRTFAGTLLRSTELPSDIKHYPILNPPINTMVGELSKRPDFAKVKAFDDDSKAEELQFKTEMLHSYIMQNAKQKLMMKLGIESQQPTEEEIDKLTFERVQEYLTSYTSTAEKWANHVLTSSKVEFNMKEISEDCFRDLLVTSREFYHVYEDNSKTGFGIENLNPLNTWFLSLPNRKYISDPSGSGKGAYAAGTIHVMELGEIIEKAPITKEEIDHLRKNLNEFTGLHVRDSNFHSDKTGEKTITYDTYSPLLQQERMFMEAQIFENGEDELLGLNSSISSYGEKFVVIQAYFQAKQKIGNVTYIDEHGDIQTMLVDETYKEIPNQITVEWGYVNRWYKGWKIGAEVYIVEPLEMFDYCPIIGVVHEVKNTKATSLVDLMKPLQIIYNICMNQLFRLLEKEIGVVYNVQIRRIPTPKDADNQDALDMWEEEARARGIIFEDDSPENIKGSPLPNTQSSRAVDLSRTSEIQSRYTLAAMIKNECWELVGITRQRLGGSSGATETATATQAGLSQSYTQTEPYFAQHDYVLTQVYQAIIDAAQYTAIKKPNSTIKYMNNEGVDVFMQINTDEIKMRDLKVFVTSRAEDQRMFEEMRNLSQHMLQNGADPYDISVLYTTNSARQLKDVFKKIKDERLRIEQSNQEIQQQQLQQQQEQFEATMQREIEDKKLDTANENLNKELDRISKEKVAIIQGLGFGKVQGEDVDANGTPDALELSKLQMEQGVAQQDYQARLMEIQQQNSSERNKLEIEREKIQVARENMKNDLQIAKENRKGRSQSKPKK